MLKVHRELPNGLLLGFRAFTVVLWVQSLVGVSLLTTPPPPCLIFPSLQSVRSDCEKEHRFPVGLDEALSSWRVQALGNTVLMLVRSTFHFPAVFQFLSILLPSQLPLCPPEEVGLAGATCGQMVLKYKVILPKTQTFFY